MARPRLDIGTFGDIWFDTEASGRVIARTPTATGTAGAASCKPAAAPRRPPSGR